MKDLRSAVIAVAEFLGRPLSEEVLDKVVEHSTFGGMKKSYDKVEKQEGGDLLVKGHGRHAYMSKGEPNMHYFFHCMLLLFFGVGLHQPFKVVEHAQLVLQNDISMHNEEIVW